MAFILLKEGVSRQARNFFTFFLHSELPTLKKENFFAFYFPLRAANFHQTSPFFFTQSCQLWRRKTCLPFISHSELPTLKKTSFRVAILRKLLRFRLNWNVLMLQSVGLGKAFHANRPPSIRRGLWESWPSWVFRRSKPFWIINFALSLTARRA